MKAGHTTKTVPLLWVQHLTLGIRQGKRILTAVEALDFKVYPGEIVGIVGESGCGKSLTSLALMGLLPTGVQITEGTVLFDGENVNTLSLRALCALRGNDLSMVFQEPMTSLNPLMKIGKQIAEVLTLHGARNKRVVEDEVLDVMKRVGLPRPHEIINAYPHQLSGGMRQRVMIAMAVIGKPKLLIADEPTTALDVTTQAQILTLLQKINQEMGTSILFISHDLGVINQLCDRVLVMYAGKLIEAGSAANIFWHPVHEYTKGLMGSIPTAKHKGKPLVSIPGRVPSLEDKKFGCAFAPRCKAAREECFAYAPQEVVLGENHSVWCFLADPESEMEYARI